MTGTRPIDGLDELRCLLIAMACRVRVDGVDDGSSGDGARDETQHAPQPCINPPRARALLHFLLLCEPHKAVVPALAPIPGHAADQSVQLIRRCRDGLASRLVS
jgi:hypothetical protein